MATTKKKATAKKPAVNASKKITAKKKVVAKKAATKAVKKATANKKSAKKASATKKVIPKKVVKKSAVVKSSKKSISSKSKTVKPTKKVVSTKGTNNKKVKPSIKTVTTIPKSPPRVNTKKAPMQGGRVVNPQITNLLIFIVDLKGRGVNGFVDAFDNNTAMPYARMGYSDIGNGDFFIVYDATQPDVQMVTETSASYQPTSFQYFADYLPHYRRDAPIVIPVDKSPNGNFGQFSIFILVYDSMGQRMPNCGVGIENTADNMDGTDVVEVGSGIYAMPRAVFNLTVDANYEIVVTDPAGNTEVRTISTFNIDPDVTTVLVHIYMM